MALGSRQGEMEGALVDGGGEGGVTWTLPFGKRGEVLKEKWDCATRKYLHTTRTICPTRSLGARWALTSGLVPLRACLTLSLGRSGRARLTMQSIYLLKATTKTVKHF